MSKESKNTWIPANYKLVFSSEQISSQVLKIAEQVSAWCNQLNSDRDVLVIPVMRGGLYFFADLTRLITCSVEIAPGRVRAYSDIKNAEALSEIYINLEGVSVSGRNVLLVDDLCDSGRTLDHLEAYIQAQGAESIKSAVLIHRKISDSGYVPDWAGFVYEGLEWFVGYGMDDCGRYSNLPQIYITDSVVK